MVELDFNIADVPEFEPIPMGEYKAVITEIEKKDTAANDGNKYLNFVIEIVEGPHKGRKIFEKINLYRTGNSPKDAGTMDIARKRLAVFIKACGKAEIKNTDEILRVIFKAKVGIRPAEGDYSAQNTIVTAMPINGGTTLNSPTGPAAVAAAAAAKKKAAAKPKPTETDEEPVEIEETEEDSGALPWA